MKLDELEKECGGNTDPIPDTCQRNEGFVPEFKPTGTPGGTITPTMNKTRTLNRLPEDAGKEINMREVVTYIPDSTAPLGYVKKTTWVRDDRPKQFTKARPDAHLGGVEKDIIELRYAYPYSEEFTHEDWAGIS